MIDNNGAMVSTSSRIHQRNSSSHNVAGDAPPVTDSYRGSTKGANQGKSVLTMINERDADSKQSHKSREVRQHQQRPNLMDEVASENDQMDQVSNELLDSEQKRSSFNSNNKFISQQSDDPLRKKQPISKIIEAVSNSSSALSQ